MNLRVKSVFNNSVVIWFLAMSPIIDIIYTINNRYLSFSFPIQQIIRIFIVFYFLYGIKNKKYRITIIALFALLTLGQVYIILNNYPYSITSNFGYIFKILNLFCVAFYIKENLNGDNFILSDLIKAIKVSGIILSLNIIMSNILKVGLKTYNYGNRSGYKGFIEAHNDVTVVLLIILPIILYSFIKYRNKLDLLIITAIIISLILIGPKAGKFLLIIEIIMFLFIYFRGLKLNSCVKKFIGFMLIFLTLFVYTDLNSTLIKLTDYASKRGYDSIYSYVVSYRNIQPRLIDNGLADKFEIHPKYLFGTGYYYGNNVLNLQKNDFYSIENDFDGLTYYSGLLTAAVIIFILALFVYNIVDSNTDDKTLKKMVIISITIALIHSFFGGHVIYSALANTYFGAILGIGFYKNTKHIDSKGL